MASRIIARRLCAWGLTVVALVSSSAPGALSDEEEAHLARIEEPDAVDEAIEKALAWLVTQQDLTTGAFKGQLANTYTGLSCMALMAAGHFPERSDYGEHLRRGILFLVKQAESNKGYLGKDGGRMYGHGICTLALAEAYGMMATPEDNLIVRNALRSAIKVILDSQATSDNQHKGGWRYEPRPGDADLSVAAWQILALRAAQNCRLEVPEAQIKLATDYVRGTYVANQGFSYQRGGPTPAMRCAGVVCMKVLGADKTPEDIEKIEKSAAILDSVNLTGGSHYYYQCYYVATAANMMGDEQREKTLPKLESALLKLQMPHGEFNKHSGHDGGVYATAFSVVCLAVRYQYLPIYQE